MQISYHKNLILLEDLDTDKIQVSSMFFSGEENYSYFTAYKDDDCKIKLLCMMLQKTSSYVKRYDGETKWMVFLIKDAVLLKKYTNI